MSLLKILTDARQFQIFFLGIFSGMPLAVLYTTLFAWLKGANVELKVITTFAIARIFYSLKFIWAPLVDHVKIPIIHRIGMRKSWMIVCAACISLLLYSYSLVDPSESIMNIYYITIALGFASATFDIAFDAFRIEKLEDNMQAMGAANVSFGYRIGMIIAGAGALMWSDKYGWNTVYLLLAGMYLICIVFLLIISEITIVRPRMEFLSLNSWKIAVFDPFSNFFTRKYSIIILLAVIFYKLGDAMLGVVATPFYLDLGFTNAEIGFVSKMYGVFATIVGSYIGGYLLYLRGNLTGMIVAGIAQSITNISFIWLNHQGHDITAFMIAITIENVASGMGNAALIGYLSYLCNKQYSATQYALFGSASGLFSHTIVVYGGAIQEMIGWDWYFAMTVVLAIPGLILLWLLDKWMQEDSNNNVSAFHSDQQLESIGSKI